MGPLKHFPRWQRGLGLAVALVVLGWLLWPAGVVRLPPGPMAPAAPVQVDLASGDTWTHDDYLVTAIAELELTAKVLGTERYRFDREADLSPRDLALGWGPMSDQTIVDMLDITQGGRWYHWEGDPLPLPAPEIVAHSANMHILSNDEAVLDMLDDVLVGEIIELSGFLVQVEADDGWRWRSSLSRSDTGGHSCEVFWVDRAERLAL